MQALIILFCVTIFCLIMRGDRDAGRQTKNFKPPHRDNDQIDRLKARVSVLEDILLDRERKFRDGI